MIIIAHRGYSEKFPENTLLSFNESYKLGAKVVEFDISMTKDNYPVVIHDETLNRTTNNKGRVSSILSHQILKLDAGSWKDKKFKDETIPSLEQVLVWASFKKDLTLNIEIKSECFQSKLNETSIEKQLLTLLKKYKLKDRVFISSFNIKILLNLRKLDSKLKISLLPLDEEIYSSKLKSYIQKIKPYSVNFSLNTISKLIFKDNVPEKKIKHLQKLYLELMKDKKIKIFIYTINNPKQLKILEAFSVGGIFTDSPNLFL